MSDLLHTENLTKDYGSFRALSDLSLGVAAGEVVGLLGPNGSGKSTALRILLGFLRPTSGRARIGGFDCWSQSVAARKLVAYLPGELRLYESMTGRQIIRFLTRLRDESLNGEMEILAKRFEIDIDRPLVQLSSGMKRKVALLAVLTPPVPLIILDEPTNALDPTMRDELLTQIRAAKDKGRAVLFSSHVMSEVEAVCDRVAILRQGKLVHMQSLREMDVGRKYMVRFERTPDHWPTIAGVEIEEPQSETVVMRQRGPAGPLLEWLGRQQVADLRVERVGLNEIYAHYHGAEA